MYVNFIIILIVIILAEMLDTNFVLHIQLNIFYRNRENLEIDNVSPLQTRYNALIFYKYTRL